MSNFFCFHICIINLSLLICLWWKGFGVSIGCAWSTNSWTQKGYQCHSVHQQELHGFRWLTHCGSFDVQLMLILWHFHYHKSHWSGLDVFLEGIWAFKAWRVASISMSSVASAPWPDIDHLCSSAVCCLLL